MYLPNEILDIIFSYVQRPISATIMKELIKNHKRFLSIKPSPNIPISNSSFPIYFFRLFYPIWKRWPENYPMLYKLTATT
jgi:hypothetical protein